MLKKVYLDTIDSTNNWCRFHTDELPVAVIAAEQTAGRGRYGRSFYSPAGSGVYMSYAFRAGYDAGDVQFLTLVAAAAVHRVLQSHCSDELAIKWVNDIYRNQRKIAGILCERVDLPDGSGNYYIIVGVGVNVSPCDVPPELQDIIGFLYDSADTSDVTSLASELSDALDEAFGRESSDNDSLGDSYADAHDDITALADYIDYYKSYCYNLPNDVNI